MAIENKGEIKPIVEQPTYPAQEQGATPESGAEQPADVEVQHSVEAAEQVNQQAPPVQPDPVPVQPQPIVKDPHLLKIEGVLSEDMGELYAALPPDVQPIFKAKGEEVAGKIMEMFAGAQVAAKKVLGLIREWLGIVPNMNKFYLEQESKIKTDQIMELANTPPDNETL
ncbi:hypothetical protein HOI83_01715 [Candidatus Uhrbacteria bacterium]|jgi:hypothetical protein|nr:hypothetical protein [Candidatus Uhrbacteria bacterium]